VPALANRKLGKPNFRGFKQRFGAARLQAAWRLDAVCQSQQPPVTWPEMPA
jgi:hypothetical protein